MDYDNNRRIKIFPYSFCVCCFCCSLYMNYSKSILMGTTYWDRIGVLLPANLLGVQRGIIWTTRRASLLYSLPIPCITSAFETVPSLSMTNWTHIVPFTPSHLCGKRKLRAMNAYIESTPPGNCGSIWIGSINSTALVSSFSWMESIFSSFVFLT